MSEWDDDDRSRQRIAASAADFAHAIDAVNRMADAFRDCIAALAEWLPGASLTLDRRRYNRARRKAVRSILAALAPKESDHA